MSDAPSRTGRPQQVTFGAGTVIAAGAIHVLSSFDDMRGLRTVDSKDRVHEIIESAGNSGFSLTQAEVLDLMHAGVLVSGAAAAAAVVMGIYALRGHRAAPPTLALMSVLVVLGSLLTDPFMGMLLAAGSAMLWTGPARDWFAGRPVRPSRVELALAESRKAGASGPGGSRVAPPPSPEPPAAPRPDAHQEPSPYQPAPSRQPAPAAYAPPYPRPVRTVRRAPGAVRAAAVITIVTSGLIAGIYALLLILLAVAREPILTELRKNPEIQRVDLGGADLIAVIAVASVLLLVWSVIAVVLAVLAWRGHNWARILLLLSSVVMVLLCLLGLPVSLPLVLIGAAVAVLLLTPQARDYFTHRFDAPAPTTGSGPAAWGGPSGNGPGHASGESPYGRPPQGQLPPPNPDDQAPSAPHPSATPPPPVPEDPTRDEDGKPPVW